MFAEALPSMGALYTMYPVLVLKDVTPGTHEFWASGWFFSEFVSAMLTKKLETFSKHIVEEYIQRFEGPDGTTRDGTMSLVQLAGDFKVDARRAEALLGVFDADLDTKRFFAESDREIVRGIVYGYVLLRQLQDAILVLNDQDVAHLLNIVHTRGWQKNLGHAIDENLNTLLHLAVSLGSVETVKVLLSDSNVDPNARNLRGDTPMQFFMFPRRGAAAELCRRAAVQRAEYHSLLPGYKELPQLQIQIEDQELTIHF